MKGFSKSSLWTLLLLAVLVPLSGYNKYQLWNNNVPTMRIKPGTVLQPMTLEDRSGAPVALADYSKDKKMTVFVVFATWCTSCRLELPQTEKLYEKYKDEGLAVVAISLDQERSKVERYLDERRFAFPVLIDSKQEFQRALHIRALPTIVVLDQQQKIDFAAAGSGRNLEQLIEIWLKNRR